MAVDNSSGVRVASYNFGSGSGTSSYYTVSAGTYTPRFYYPSVPAWYNFVTTGTSNVWTVNLSAGYRYTISLLYNSGGFSATISNDGTIPGTYSTTLPTEGNQAVQVSPPLILSK
jgi:hypothetical protein